MNFTDLRFLPFLALAVGVTWCLRASTHRKAWLLAASYAFYAFWDWRFLGLLVASTLVDFTAGRAIFERADPRSRRRWLAVSLAVNLGVLGFFKYLGFFLESTQALLGTLGVSVSTPVLEFVLPLGISFYTFQTLSYTLDIYRGQLQPTRSLLDMALFVAFFPQLVAGPIVRARRFLPQLQRRRRPPSGAYLRGLVLLFLAGMFKKACVADNLGLLVDRYFASPEAHSVLDAWSATLLFTAQIYCDFSGYSDIALATAGFLGYRLPKNFDYPYLQPNLSRAWAAWHITMTRWFRDYVYFSLGGGRGGGLLRARNVMITMLVVGLWHGAHERFLVWGAVHGLGLLLYGAWSASRGPRPGGPLWIAASTLATFLFACATMVIFRAPDLDVVWTTWGRLVGIGGQAASTFGLGPLVVFAGLAAAHLVTRARLLAPLFRRLPAPAFYFLCGVLAAVVLATMRTHVHPFLYFEF